MYISCFPSVRGLFLSDGHKKCEFSFHSLLQTELKVIYSFNINQRSVKEEFLVIILGYFFANWRKLEKITLELSSNTPP